MILEHLPPSVIRSLPELSLLLVGIMVEKHYVSRVTVLTNTTALTVHYLSLSDPTPLFAAYVEIGLLLGGYGFIQYVRKASVDRPFYLLAFYFYSSLTVGLFIFTALPPFWAVVLAIGIQMFMAAWRGGVSEWVYVGARPADLQWFIANNSVVYPDYRSGRQVEVPLRNIFD